VTLFLERSGDTDGFLNRSSDIDGGEPFFSCARSPDLLRERAVTPRDFTCGRARGALENSVSTSDATDAGQVLIALPLLLLVTAPSAVPMPTIAIDPCVEVDADEVRRLAALELHTWRAGPSASALSVLVTCGADVQELRLTDGVSGQETVRTLDLNAASGTDRDAKTRELALAIAELLRRVQVDSTPEPEPAPAPAPMPSPIAQEPSQAAPSEPDDDDTGARPFRLELGAAARGTTWTGGEVLLGADVSARTHLRRWLIAELRVGGGKTRQVELRGGTLDANGMTAAAGVALDVGPSWRNVGVALGARLGAEWLRYAAIDRDGVAYGGRDAGALTASGTVNAFIKVSAPICLTVDAAVGGALHSIAIRDNGQKVSGLGGVLFSSAFGIASHF
jgi:hypothetical protein